MTKDQRTKELYRLSYQCNLAQQTKRCVRGEQCKACAFNILGYTSMYSEDQCDAALIQSSAAIDVANALSKQRYYNITQVTKALVMVGLLVFIGLKIHSCRNPPPTQFAKRSNITPAELADIREAQEAIDNSVFDINGDNLINCIDYAIFFCILMDKSKIIINQNPKTGMNHLFNRVKLKDGTYAYIEPQLNSKGPLMEDVWGSKYDWAYNQDKTVIYAFMAQMMIFSRMQLDAHGKEFLNQIADTLYQRAQDR